MKTRKTYSTVDVVLSSLVMLLSLLFLMIWVGYGLALYGIASFGSLFSASGSSPSFPYSYLLPSAFLLVVFCSAIALVRGALLVVALLLVHALLACCVWPIFHIEHPLGI